MRDGIESAAIDLGIHDKHCLAKQFVDMTCVDLSFLEMISLPLSRIVLTITIGRYFKYIINISNNIPYFLRLQEVLDPFGVRLREKENEQWLLGRGVTASGEAKSPLTWAEHTHHNLF